MKSITLFSSAGIGDLAIKACGIEILVACEILKDRASLHRVNFPKTKMIQGDIREKKNEIIRTTKTLLKGTTLDFVFATPPCQGMSSNGKGTLLKGIRAGKKPKYDIRNQLIIPTMDIIEALSPNVVLFENVPGMEYTEIEDENNSPINIIEYIKMRLGSEYAGKAKVVQFADYGIAQRRSRLITIFTKLDHVKDYLETNNSLNT